ncbi:MAG: GNAT family N-acetyltransferase [Myxococcaceae bacterium]|nr:GNAT family N-acetyltransferase [Myxococcaceae bacterium]
MEFSIRQATQADADRIAELHVQAWQWAYRDVFPDEFLDTMKVGNRALLWRAALETPAMRVWLAERDGALLGFTSTNPSRDPGAGTSTGELGALYVRKEIAGSGIAAALLAWATKDLHARGFQPLTAWVFEKNQRARRFFEKHGWTTDGEVKVETIGGKSVRELRHSLQVRRSAG